MWFFKKKSIEAVCFEIHDIVISAPLDGYKEFASQAYDCSPDLVEKAVSQHWAALELGALKPEEFWDKVGASLTALGVGHNVPGWKFKGIWDGIVSDVAKLDPEMMSTVRQIRATKIRTLASANLTQELAAAYQKVGAFEPFSRAVLSCTLGERKPSAKYFQRMRKLAQTSAAGCLYVDKDEHNLKAAKSAGYRTLAFSNPGDTRWELIQLGVMG